MSWSQFYEYKQAFQKRGFGGLMNHLPISQSSSSETTPEVKKKVIGRSGEHRSWGPLYFTNHLRLEGVSASPGTVRTIWLKEDMETPYKRLLRLEEAKSRA